ncbi:MAG: pyrroline-5-carboxylate reductase, partial [Clostridia bacterium]|nr:pyrroline-5-carboxylate reductase [Clostridia bacterium]
YFEENKNDPAELKNRVTSPAGTTAEGIFALERGGFRAAAMSAVRAAFEKAGKLKK